MGFDLIIFVFTCTALLRNSTRSGLWHLLFRDGLIYWAVTFSVNCIPAVSPTFLPLSVFLILYEFQVLNSLDLNSKPFFLVVKAISNDVLFSSHEYVCIQTLILSLLGSFRLSIATVPAAAVSYVFFRWSPLSACLTIEQVNRRLPLRCSPPRLWT